MEREPQPQRMAGTLRLAKLPAIDFLGFGGNSLRNHHIAKLIITKLWITSIFIKHCNNFSKRKELSGK